MKPTVSIVIVNYFHPEVINVCLRSLEQTSVHSYYEVVVVDNGSDEATVGALKAHKDEGRIDTLILEPENHFFSEGNNIGVRASDPSNEYILLLNSDVGFLRGDWLNRQLAWMEGTAWHQPTIWGLKPAVPIPGPKDIVSIGWSHDVNIPSMIRPEGWCCLLRRSVWREMSPDFPFHYGFEEMVGLAGQDGARIGSLCQYSKYLVHREGGSGRAATEIVNKRTPDIPGWFAGVQTEGLDFALGPDEHDSYLEW